MTRSAGEVVHEVSVSESAFAIIVEAIGRLSLKRHKFQKFKDVVLEGIKSSAGRSGEAGLRFADKLPVDGEIRLYLRLNAETNGALDRLKTQLNQHAQGRYGVRETLIFCAFVVAEPDFLSCQMLNSGGTL